MSSVGGVTGLNGVNGGLDISGPLSAANALTAIRRYGATSVTISDSTQNILKNLDALQAVAVKIGSLTTTDTNQNMVVAATQFQKDGAALALWGAGSGQTVSVVNAKATFTATPPSYVSSVSVLDSRVGVQAHLDNLQTLAASGVLEEIVQSGSATPLTITAAQLVADQTALGKIKNGGYSLAITNASVSDVLGLDPANPALASNGKVKSIAIVDTTDAIASNLDDLQRVGLRVKTITQTDATAHLEVTGQQYQQDKLVLGKILTSDMLDVMDASASQARALAADTHVVTVDINDNAAGIAKNWALLQKLTDLTSVTVTDQGTAIQLTAAQYNGGTAVLSKFDESNGNTYKLAVTGVSAGTAASVAAGHNVSSLDVTDSSSAIASKLDDLVDIDGQGKLSSVTLTSPSGAITMDAAALQGDALTATQGVLNKIKGGSYSLSVTGAATSALGDLAANRHVTAIAISDSGANIASALDTLQQLGKRISTIGQTDAGAVINVTQSQLETRAAVLGKILGGYTINVSGVSAAKATADANNMHIADISVSDTGKNIAANWSALRALGANVAAITKTDGGAITLSAANYELGVHDNLTAKLSGGTTFAVTSASVADAQSLASDNAVTQIDVADESSSIASNITALETLVAGGTKLHSITNSTPTDSLSLAASQLTDAQSVLGLIKGGSYTLSVSGVDASDAKDLLANNHKIATIAVTGDAASIVANLPDLNSLGRKMTTITQTDAGTVNLQMTGSLFLQNAGALAKIESGYLVDLTDVDAAKAGVFASNTAVNTVAVSDTGANLASGWGTLAQLGGKLAGVAQSDSATLQLSMADWSSAQGTQGLRSKFESDPTVSISGAAVSQVSDLASDSAVESFQVNDTADAISAGLADLAAQTNLTQIVVSDPSVALTMSSADYANSTDVLGLIHGNYTVALSDVTAADGATLASDAHVSSMDVVDTSSEVSTNFSALAGASNLNSITLSDQDGTVSLTAAQIFASGSTLDKVTGSYQLAATGVAMADLADITSIPQVSSVSINDSADNVSANFSDLLALGDNLSSIDLTDASPVLSLSQSDWSSGTTALGAINGTYQVDVTDTVAGDAQAVAADSTVRNVEVSDTASNITGQWDTLVGLYNGGSGKLTALSLTDTNPLILTAAQQTAGADMIAALLPDETIQTA